MLVFETLCWTGVGPVDASRSLWNWMKARCKVDEQVLWQFFNPDEYITVEPQEAVPEVSKGKVYRNQKKHVHIGIDCDLLNTSISISHTTLFWWWLERRGKKYHKVLLHSTKYLYCFGTAPYCEVLLRYYSVLCTTKFYSSTTKYYCVLQSTTPYYKVLLQYYSVLFRTTKYCSVVQSTTSYSVVQITTKYYSVLQSTTKYYSVLFRTTLYTTKYYSLLQYYCNS